MFSTYHPAASSLVNFNIDDLYDSTLYLHQLFSSRQEPTFVMASQLTLFGDSTVNNKSTQRAFGFFYLANTLSYTRATKEASQFWGAWSIFAFSLLSPYWVLNAYFLAVLEISVCAY